MECFSATIGETETTDLQLIVLTSEVFTNIWHFKFFSPDEKKHKLAEI